MDRSLSGEILAKFNTRSITLLIAFVLILAGILMIFKGIKDDGYIDISAFEVSGQIKTGLVGLSLVFCGSFLCSLAALSQLIPNNRAENRSSLKYSRNDDGRIEFEVIGHNPRTRKEVLEAIQKLSLDQNRPSDT